MMVGELNMCMGMSGRSETVGLLHLKFKRLSQLPKYSDRGLSRRRYSSVDVEPSVKQSGINEATSSCEKLLGDNTNSK